MIRYYQPDILGIEEGLYEQVDYMHQSLTAYSYVGVGRDGGNNGEFSAIFYKHQNLTVLETETYWLSETPRIPSKGWDADYNRVVTFACFRHNTTHDTLYVFNTHWDHIGEIARKNSADYLLSLIEEKGLSAKMVVVMGDFNGEPQDAPIVVMKSALNDAYDISQTPPYGPVGTFNGFDANMQANRRIDYVFVKNMTVANYRTIDDRRNNYLFLSDHFPVLVELAKPH